MSTPTYVFKHINGRDIMPAFPITTFSNAIFLAKMFEFRSRFHSMFVLINNTPALVQIMACAARATSHCLNQWWWDCWRIYPSFGLNELTSRNTQNDAQIPKYFEYWFGWYLKFVCFWMFVRGRWWHMPECTWWIKHIESEKNLNPRST